MPDPSGPETPPAKRPTWRARVARFLATIEARVPPGLRALLGVALICGGVLPTSSK
jgi:hypothetical protein